MKPTSLPPRLKQFGLIILAILVPGGIIVLLFVSLLRLGKARVLTRNADSLRAA